jgi:hypothetical protein
MPPRSRVRLSSNSTGARPRRSGATEWTGAFHVFLRPPNSGSAVGLFAVLNAGDFDDVFFFVIEEDAVVAAAEAEAGTGRL